MNQRVLFPTFNTFNNLFKVVQCVQGFAWCEVVGADLV